MRKLTSEQAADLLKDLDIILSKPQPFTIKAIKLAFEVQEKLGRVQGAIKVLNQIYFEKDEKGDLKLYKFKDSDILEMTGELTKEEKDDGWKLCNKVPDNLLNNYLQDKAKLDVVEFDVEEFGIDKSTLEPEPLAIFLKHNL